MIWPASVFMLQLCQMLSAPWQISPEQKENQHQEKHYKPSLQWNFKGDDLSFFSCLTGLQLLILLCWLKDAPLLATLRHVCCK